MKEITLNIIEKAFLNKKDKAGKPYIDHLKRVAENACAIAPYGFVDKIEIVALLHDLIEDCPEWTIEHIEAIFNDSEITNALTLLTRKCGDNYDEYVQRIGCSLISRIVKLADLKDNMNLTRLDGSLTDKDIERIKKYHRSYLYLDNIGRKVECVDSKTIIDKIKCDTCDKCDGMGYIYNTTGDNMVCDKCYGLE